MRNYTEISKDKFLKEVKVIMDHEEYPYVLPKKISKDISKVSFDFENYTDFNEKYGFGYPVGYKELSPGFHTFFVNAGGDWEHPICFILYWGDGILRGYVPKDGNAWDKKEKRAYDDGEEHNEEINDNKIFNDIVKHIVKK